MTPKDTAEQLVRKHVTAIAEESMDSDNILFYAAKQCALVTVDMILSVRAGYPYPFEIGLEVSGIVENINFPSKYWTDVKEEIKKM